MSVVARGHVARAALACLLSLALAACGELGAGLGLPGGGGGGGGGGAGGAQAESLHAIGQLVELVEAGGVTHVAQLFVFTTATGEVEALTGVSGAHVEVAGERTDLPTTSFVGLFERRFAADSGFALREDDEVRFGFTLIDDAGTERAFEASVFTPDLALSAEVAPATIYFANEPLELTIDGWDGYGWVQVVDQAADAVTVSTLDNALPGLVDQRAQLRSVNPQLHVVPAAAFPAPGVYRLEIASLGVADAESAPAQLSSGLGSYSWFGSGRRVALEVEVR